MSIITIGKFEFNSDTCKVCPQMEESFYQGNLCSRCPIVNCGKDEDGFCLLEPEEYRLDWAEEFYNWINGGFKNYPKLML